MSLARGARARKRATTRGTKRVRERREIVAQDTIPAPPGAIWILATEAGVREIRLTGKNGPSREEKRALAWKLVRRPRWTGPARRALERYLAGRDRDLALPLDLAQGTPFQRRVWEAARRIPFGQVTSYADLARASGSERAQRAVGNALAANPVPIVIPCHRIVHSDRSLGGFTAGLAWKRFLLEVERGQLPIDWRPRRRFLFTR